MHRKHTERPKISFVALASIVGMMAATGIRQTRRQLAQMPSAFGRRPHSRSTAFRVGAWAGDGVPSKRTVKPRTARTR